MAEQLYTIPVNDAFSTDCECPLCLMQRDLEKDAIEFTMGPSYMEDDNREVTDKLGFCRRHLEIMYKNKNKLGLALMLKTHTDKTIREMKALAGGAKPKASGLFSKKQDTPAVVDYIKKLESTCFVCGRITPVFERYIDTIFHMWKKDKEFVEKFGKCKGFCTKHYGMLYEAGADKLNQTQYDEFLTVLNKIYFEGMDRVNADMSWFIDKHDYRNKQADWGTSRDSLQRALIKVGSTIVDLDDK